MSGVHGQTGAAADVAPGAAAGAAAGAARMPEDPFADERFDAHAAECARLFIRHLDVERGLSPHTIRAYAGDVRAYLDWAARDGADPLHLTHRRFRRYMAEIDRAGYARKTACRRLAAVRSFFSYLGERGILDANPAAVAATPKVARELPRVVSQADIDKLLSSCDGPSAVDMRDRAFLELLYACGARIAEIAALKPGDIDFAVGELRLFGKGGKERIVPLHELACSCARAYLDMARPQLLVKGPVAEMFVSTRGNPMSAAALRRVFHERAARAGLDPSLHPHDIRHAFATDLVEGGADLRSVQDMLGHASLSTTQIYANLSLEHMKQTYARTHPRA